MLVSFGVLHASAHFSGQRQETAIVQTGGGAWFYLQLLPGSPVQSSGMPTATGLNRSLALNYGQISSTMGLLDLPILGLLYEPALYAATFAIVNKSTVPITITTFIVHSSGPGAIPLGELLYAIPASQYSGTAGRAPTYTFTLQPASSVWVHSVIATGSLIRNVLGLLLFSPYPLGSYSGYVRLQVQYENHSEAILIPAAFTVY